MGSSPVIQPKKCTGCGLCVQVCPSDILSMAQGRVMVKETGCIACDHCRAVCPANAVDVYFDADLPEYKRLAVGQGWISSGLPEKGQFLNILHSRRSCRLFLDEEVEKELLEDLVTAGTAAPSGTNSQKCSFTVLPSRDQVFRLGILVADFYRRLNALAERPAARLLNRWFGSGRLEQYFRDHYRQVRQALRDYDFQGRDRLFHGATALIAIGAEDTASCPKEDAILAASNILLAAHLACLGSCMIGYAVEAGRRDPEIQKFLQLSKGEKLYAVIALGHPAVSFLRPVRKKQRTMRFLPSEV